MSVKTCQLCGKPLGRIRGSDGDFCSKEHRNQYRLRRGLDRLEEADKVATMMRRRENLRAIPAAELQAAGAFEPRASAEALAFPARQVEPRFAPLKPALFQPRVPQRAGRFSSPVGNSGHAGAEPNPLMTPATQPFVARRPATALDSKKSTKPGVGVVRAGSTSIPCRVSADVGAARECGAALRVARRPASPRRRNEPNTTAAASLEKARQMQALALHALGSGSVEARAHAGREFARRSLLVPGGQRSLELQFGLPEPKPQAGYRAEAQEMPAATRLRDIPRTLGMPCVPKFRGTMTVSGTRGGGPSPIRPVEPTMDIDPRLCGVRWEAAGAVSPPNRRSRAVRRTLPETAPPIKLDPCCDAARDHRAAEVAFGGGSADQPFEPAPMDLHDVFAEAGRPSLDVIEEHFDSGLEQWSGDTVDWKLDAAGARPAGLALFRPTLSLSDYEFEFFTRIENRAVSYAFRAANVSNYLKITIAMVEPGRYELRRCAVIGGIEEPAASAPLPGVIRPGTAFTIKTRAVQNDFTIWLEGELAARWTDGRMPTGGIGFMAPRDDRARVYWVRLSQIESPNSGAGTHRPVRSIQ